MSHETEYWPRQPSMIPKNTAGSLKSTNLYIFFDLNLNCVFKACVSLVCLDFYFKFTSKSPIEIALNIYHPGLVSL